MNDGAGVAIRDPALLTPSRAPPNKVCSIEPGLLCGRS